MQTTSTNPSAAPAVGILDPTATLLATATLLTTAPLPSAHPATPNTAIDSFALPPGTDLPPFSFLLLAARLAELCEMAFPDRPDWLTETVEWRDESDVTAAVERFLQRVGTLFPVQEEMWDSDLEIAEWRLYEIPLVLMGLDEWDDGWDDLKEPIPYLLHAIYSRGDDESPGEFAALYPTHLLPRYLEPHRLVDTLREMNLAAPLAALPDLILMVNHATDNLWLDVGEMALAEGGGYPVWEREQIVWLTEQWQAAQPILAR
ncbi:MAG: hypothetical protein WAS33_04105, partial [Candidatus Promineifilaceae bacterium]